MSEYSCQEYFYVLKWKRRGFCSYKISNSDKNDLNTERLFGIIYLRVSQEGRVNMSSNCIRGTSKKELNTEKLLRLEKDFYRILTKLKDGICE